MTAPKTVSYGSWKSPISSSMVASGGIAFDTPETAESNVTTLQERLTEGRSIMYHRPLAELWTIRGIKADGTLLRAEVKLIEPEEGKTLYLTGMIYMPDYWFLYPD